VREILLTHLEFSDVGMGGTRGFRFPIQRLGKLGDDSFLLIILQQKEKKQVQDGDGELA